MRVRLLWLLAAVLGLAGAAQASGITDATGRTVTIPDHPARILPAGPPAAVLLEALAPDLMIGWPHKPSPAQLAFLPSAVGSLPQTPMLTGRTDEAAAVPALHPDLVLDYGTVSPRYVQLDEAIQARTGVPTILLDGSLSRSPQVIRMLGAALHRQARAEELAGAAERVLGAVRHPAGKPATVLYARGADGLEVAAPGTGATEAFSVLGWTVLAPAGSGTFRRAANVAAIRTLDPDRVIFQDADMQSTVATVAAWQALRAVRSGQAFIAPSLPFGWFGEPPSINRLIGVAAFENPASVGPLIATLVGRTPPEPLPTLRPIGR